MGLFDVFKKNDNSEGGEYHSMERSADAPTAGAVRQAVETPAPAATSAASQPPRSAQQAPKPQAMDTPLPAITPNKLMSVNNPEILKREDSARVLGYFIERYDADKTVANLQNCMNNFMDVWLWVPMRMQFSTKDAAGFKTQTMERKYVPKDPVRLVPELLKAPNGDVLYFSFTSRDEISESFMQKYVWMQMPSLQSSIFIAKHPEVTAIVINPFSKNLALKRDFMMKVVKKKNPDGTVESL
jgi:hypothetical protein